LSVKIPKDACPNQWIWLSHLKLKPRNLFRPFHPPPPFLTGLLMVVFARGSDAASSRVAFCQRRKLRHPLKLILSSALSAAHDARVKFQNRSTSPRKRTKILETDRTGNGNRRRVPSDLPLAV
jgi:hypothetical protein